MKNPNFFILNKSKFNVFMATICLSLALFFSNASWADGMHGVFMVVKGNVNLTNNQAQIKKVKVGDKVVPGDLVETTIDSRAKIVMSDRNVINVSPETKLKIEKYENNGEDKNVEMNLLEGKVRNNVEQKYDGEKNKFIVKTPTAVAGVRGTQFFTSFDPGTKLTSVVTLRGAVSLAPLNMNLANAKPVVIKMGESTTLAPGANPETPKPMPKEDLKKLDQESTVSAAPSKQDTPKETAKGDTKSDDKKSDAKDSNSSTASTSGTATNETSSNNAGSPPAEPAAASGQATSNSAPATAAEPTATASQAPAATASEPAAASNASRAPASIDPSASTASSAMTPSAAAPAPFKMVEVGDVDVGQFKQILPPATAVSQPKPPSPTLVNKPVTAVTPVTVINDIIRGTTGKAHVIIIPQLPK
jgi:hypothetical protein